MQHEDKELKKEFQVERLALFSDAVFAIAITLLVIEMKIPELKAPHTDGHLAEVMASELVAKFIGFVVSFTVIAVYWINHHQLLGFVTGHNRKLLWANMYLLFTIVLMPFSSGMYSEYWFSNLLIPIGIYTLNILASSLMLMRLWRIIINPAYHLCEQPPARELVRYHRARNLVAPFVFVLSFFAARVDLWTAYLLPATIPIIMQLIKARYRKKAPAIFREG